MTGKKRAQADAPARKPRITFTEPIKLELIKLCVELECHPKITKMASWIHITNELMQMFDLEMSARVVQAKVKELVSKYQKDQLVFKTGQEEYESELKSLLESLCGPMEKDDIEVIEDDSVGPETVSVETKPSPINTKKERVIADDERDELVSKANSSLTPEALGLRRKRTMISFDEQLIKEKQDHDNQVELKRLDLEKIKSDREYEMELKRHKLEEDKIQLAAEDSKRTAEVQTLQLQTQKEMLDLMKVLVQR